MTDSSDFFPCICLIAASRGCCSWEQRLAAARVSLQEPSKTLECLPQLQEVTPWAGSSLHTDQDQGSLHWECTLPLCPWLLMLLRCAALLLSALCWVECPLSLSWLSVWSWHGASLKYSSSLTDLPNSQAERGSDTAAMPQSTRTLSLYSLTTPPQA